MPQSSKKKERVGPYSYGHHFRKGREFGAQMLQKAQEEANAEMEAVYGTPSTSQDQGDSNPRQASDFKQESSTILDEETPAITSEPGPPATTSESTQSASTPESVQLATISDLSLFETKSDPTPSISLSAPADPKQLAAETASTSDADLLTITSDVQPLATTSEPVPSTTSITAPAAPKPTSASNVLPQTKTSEHRPSTSTSDLEQLAITSDGQQLAAASGSVSSKPSALILDLSSDDSMDEQSRLDYLIFKQHAFDDILFDDDLDFYNNMSAPQPENTTGTRDNLKQYVLDYGLTQRQTHGLLKFIRQEFDRKDIPLSPVTLLALPKVDIEVRSVPPGDYVHFGIQKTITVEKYPFIRNSRKVQVDICIDGVPLVDGSKLCMWPILGAFVGRRNVNPFLIGVYIGRGSPNLIEELLSDYVEEFKLLNGLLQFEGGTVPFEIRAYCCDAPARAFLTSVQYHTGYRGCAKCIQVGYRLDHTTVFQNRAMAPRTDLSYKNRTDPRFHSKAYLAKPHPLEGLGTGMISQVPLEPMHLLDLGVMKKVIVIFLENRDKRYFLQKELIQETETHFLKIVPFVPKEFQRAPRVFAEVPRFKATEFRQFLLYTGPIVLRDTLESKAYDSFMKLHIAARFCYLHQQLDFAELLFQSFVMDFGSDPGSVFPEKYRSYNIHSLLHAAADFARYGLESISNYKFENYLQIIKNRLRASSNLFSRVVNVVNSGVLDRTSLHFGEISYDPDKAGDRHCSLKDGRIVEISDIRGDVATGRLYLANGISDFYSNAHPQCKLLEVFIIDPQQISTDVIKFSIAKSVRHKLFCIPYRDKYVVLPLIHTT